MYPPSKRKSTKYTSRLLFLLLTGTLLSLKISTVANDAHTSDEIPTGFGVERYASLWERNPFTLAAPVAPETHHSPFDKLFLTSWLKDGKKDVIFIQNFETNQAQKVTVEPNQDNLRLIALHLSPDPQLVEAVISDGKQQGPVKFRLESSPSGQTTPPTVQTALPSNQVQAGLATSQQVQPISQNSAASTSSSNGPVGQPRRRRPGSPVPRSQLDAGRTRSLSGQQSEAVRLPDPH